MAVKVDRSWFDRHIGERPANVNYAGLQSQRFARIDFEKDKRKVIFQKSDLDATDSKVGIQEPLNCIWREHEPNSGMGIFDDQRGLQQFTDETLAGQVDISSGTRKRPHSKVFAAGLLIDDKHIPSTRLNRSSWFTRYSDYRMGDTDDLWQVREILFDNDIVSAAKVAERNTSLLGATAATEIADENTAPPGDNPASEPKQSGKWKLMDLLNSTFNDEGSYVWRGPSPNLRQARHVDKVLDVIPGFFGQKADFWHIPAAINYGTTQNDAEQRSLLSMRDDAQVCYVDDETKRGRIYFTLTDISAAVEGTGTKIKGEMALDLTKANFNTDFKKETGEWRPVITLPQTYSDAGGVGGEPALDFPYTLKFGNLMVADGDYGKGTTAAPISFVIGADTYTFKYGILTAVAGPG